MSDAIPEATLLEVRSEAIRWEREGMPGGVRGRSHSVSSAAGFQFAVAGGTYSGLSNLDTRSELAELKQMLKQQQEQLNQLSSSLLALKHTPKPPFRPVKQSIICRRSQRPGHFARECDVDRVPAEAQPSSHAGTTNSDRPYSQNWQSGNFRPLNC